MRATFAVANSMLALARSICADALLTAASAVAFVGVALIDDLPGGITLHRQLFGPSSSWPASVSSLLRCASSAIA